VGLRRSGIRATATGVRDEKDSTHQDLHLQVRTSRLRCPQTRRSSTQPTLRQLAETKLGPRRSLPPSLPLLLSDLGHRSFWRLRCPQTRRSSTQPTLRQLAETKLGPRRSLPPSLPLLLSDLGHRSFGRWQKTGSCRSSSVADSVARPDSLALTLALTLAPHSPSRSLGFIPTWDRKV
jgi:hypothetical protein